MRIKLSKQSKKELKDLLLKHHKASNMKELSRKLNISKNTLDNWFYNKKIRIPKEKIPSEILSKLDILEAREDNWGQVKGGKKTYKIILKKYGKKEIRRRQIEGGRKSPKQKLEIELKDPRFLEFYGALLGDGWLSKLSYQYPSGKQKLWWIGISGHKYLDKSYLTYLSKIVKKLFYRKTIFKYKKRKKGMEFIFSHKKLLLFLNNKLGFPIGKKKNLAIYPEFAKDYESMKHVIKGIFDTDGCFYLDETSAGNPYPCISIEMKAPILIKQIYQSLLDQNFKVMHQKKERRQRIALKGRKQLNLWMEKIGSSNLKHANKINALVAQQDSAAPS